MSAVNINIRTDDDVKRKAEQIFDELGLNMSTAINIFLRQAIRVNGIPFEVKLETPNTETLEAMKEYDAMMRNPDDYKRYASAHDAFSEVLENA